MIKQDGAAAPRTPFRTDRPSPATFLVAGAGAGSAIAYMAAGMPIPTGAVGIAVGTTLGATAIGLMVAEVIAEWRRPAPLTARQDDVRAFAPRTSQAPTGALTCEDEAFSDRHEPRRPSHRRAAEPEPVLSGAAVPGGYR